MANKSKDQNDKSECFLDVLLDSEVYSQNIEKISNDIVIVLSAATDTSRNTITIVLSHFAKNKASSERARAEIDALMKKKGITDILKAEHNQVNADELPHLYRVIDECMRVNPPLPTTEEFIVLKDCNMGGINFTKGSSCMFHLYGLHHNPNEWQKPEQFLPERFDPSHELFKTPKGEKRNPMSFLPFTFGERKCVGYQFARVLIPNITIRIHHHFEMEFIDKEMLED